MLVQINSKHGTTLTVASFRNGLVTVIVQDNKGHELTAIVKSSDLLDSLKMIVGK